MTTTSTFSSIEITCPCCGAVGSTHSTFGSFGKPFADEVERKQGYVMDAMAFTCAKCGWDTPVFRNNEDVQAFATLMSRAEGSDFGLDGGMFALVGGKKPNISTNFRDPQGYTHNLWVMLGTSGMQCGAPAHLGNAIYIEKVLAGLMAPNSNSPEHVKPVFDLVQNQNVDPKTGKRLRDLPFYLAVASIRINKSWSSFDDYVKDPVTVDPSQSPLEDKMLQVTGYKDRKNSVVYHKGLDKYLKACYYDRSKDEDHLYDFSWTSKKEATQFPIYDEANLDFRIKMFYLNSTEYAECREMEHLHKNGLIEVVVLPMEERDDSKLFKL